jgi:hypothetical protein
MPPKKGYLLMFRTTAVQQPRIFSGKKRRSNRLWKKPNRCVYRKLKPGCSGDEVRQEWGTI